ncbi:Hypothetical protein POVN_LOCUS581 [uncultured virus]|nr:Hypothetical protein POVN_LOCUS581 [uncultured virus]
MCCRIEAYQRLVSVFFVLAFVGAFVLLFASGSLYTNEHLHSNAMYVFVAAYFATNDVFCTLTLAWLFRHYTSHLATARGEMINHLLFFQGVAVVCSLVLLFGKCTSGLATCLAPHHIIYYMALLHAPIVALCTAGWGLTKCYHHRRANSRAEPHSNPTEHEELTLEPRSDSEPAIL